MKNAQTLECDALASHILGRMYAQCLDFPCDEPLPFLLAQGRVAEKSTLALVFLEYLENPSVTPCKDVESLQEKLNPILEHFNVTLSPFFSVWMKENVFFLHTHLYCPKNTLNSNKMLWVQIWKRILTNEPIQSEDELKNLEVLERARGSSNPSSPTGSITTFPRDVTEELEVESIGSDLGQHSVGELKNLEVLERACGSSNPSSPTSAVNVFPLELIEIVSVNSSDLSPRSKTPPPPVPVQGNPLTKERTPVENQRITEKIGCWRTFMQRLGECCCCCKA